jgi:hypothetical protein
MKSRHYLIRLPMLLLLALANWCLSIPRNYSRQHSSTLDDGDHRMAMNLPETILAEDSTESIILHSEACTERIADSPGHRYIKKLERDLNPIEFWWMGEYWFGNPHATRYFFMPQRSMVYRKGKDIIRIPGSCYNQVNYGITDNLTLGGGIVPLFLFAGAPTPVLAHPQAIRSGFQG